MAEKQKYDTNPLDPDFASQAEDDWGATRSYQEKENRGPETGGVRLGSEASTREQEAPTRRYDPAPPSYPSIFTPPTYQPPAVHGAQQYPLTVGPPSSRHVTGLHLPENFTMILPYMPAYIGIVASIVELLVVPRTEVRVRFHAAQGLALQLAITAISIFFKLIGLVTGSYFGGSIFWAASTVFLIVSMVRVWKGESHHIAALDEGTRWLNEHIEPKK